ncbi:MAG: hypothetical protein ACOCOR_05370 [Prevotella sp.]
MLGYSQLFLEDILIFQPLSFRGCFLYLFFQANDISCELIQFLTGRSFLHFGQQRDVLKLVFLSFQFVFGLCAMLMNAHGNFGVDTAVGDLLKDKCFFVVRTVEELCKFALCQHRRTAKLVETESHHTVDHGSDGRFTRRDIMCLAIGPSPSDVLQLPFS